MVLNIVFFCGSAASAQSVDLENMPSDYSFVSRSEDGNTTVTYLGRDGDSFKFTLETDDSRRQPDFQYRWMNKRSQTVRTQTPTYTAEYLPHDCAPKNGNCYFTARREGNDDLQANRKTFRIGDVWVDNLYVVIDGETLFLKRSCTTFDEYGFWIDYVYEESNGTTGFGQRISSSVEPAASTPFKELQAICRDAEGLTS